MRPWPHYVWALGAAAASLLGACGGRTPVLVDTSLSPEASPLQRDAGLDSFVLADVVVDAPVSHDVSVEHPLPCSTSVLVISTAPTAPPGLVTGLTTASPALCRVDYLNANSGTPSLSDLMPYGAVLAANENGSPYDDPSGLGDVLGSYFDAGGQVVIALFADGGYALGGSFVDRYILILPSWAYGDSSNSYSSTDPSEDLVPTSPVVANVSSITGFGWFGSQSLEHGGAVVAAWASGDPLAVTGVVTDATGAQRHRVDLNILPSDVGSGNWSADGFVLLANALLYR
jgi:hypothetical protein